MTREEATSTSRGAFLGWVGFSLLLFYAIVIGGGWLGMYTGPVRILNLVIIAVALVAWLVIAWLRREWRPSTVIWPAFVAPLLAFGLSILASEHQRIGLDFLAYAVLLTALYLLLVRIMALPYARARIGGLVAAITFVLTAAYIIWSLSLWAEWWGLVGEIRVPPLRPAQLGMTWGSPSVVFTVLTLLTSVAIGGLGLRTRGARITAVVLVVMLVVAGFISGSRSGWLAMAGTIVIVGALALIDARGRDTLAVLWSRRAFRLALIPVAIVLAVGAIVIGPIVLGRLGAGDGGRLEIWATALRMFGDAPALGFGPGSWMVRRVAYTEPGELDWYQPHAHSQYFQTAAELGLVGLLAGVVAFAAVGWLLVRALRGGDPERRRWAWTSVFGLTYLALNVFVDTHTIPTVALLVGLPIAVLDATSSRGIGLPLVSDRVARWLRSAALLLLALACVAALVQLTRSESTALTHQRAVTAAGDGDWSAALEPALDAAAAEPEVGVYHMTAALAQAAAGEWQSAEAAYRRAIEIDDLPTAWLGLAQAQLEQGRPAEEVARSLAESLRLGEQQAALAFAAGQLYERSGMTDEADVAFAHALTILPSLAADAAWGAELGADRLAGITAAAMAEEPDVAWEIALMAGDIGRARELVADREAFFGDVVEARGGDALALDAVQAAALADPMDASKLSLAARASDHAGEADAADDFRRLSRLGPHYGPTTVAAAYGLRDPIADEPMGTSTHFYGRYTYRRVMPVDLLPPGLPGIVIAETLRSNATDP